MSSSRNSRGSSASNPIDLLSSSPEGPQRPSYIAQPASDESDSSLRNRQGHTQHTVSRRPKREPATDEDGTVSDRNGRRTRSFRGPDRNRNRSSGSSARASSSSGRQVVGTPLNPIVLGESPATRPGQLMGVDSQAGSSRTRDNDRDTEAEVWRRRGSLLTANPGAQNPLPLSRRSSLTVSRPAQAPGTPSRPTPALPALPASTPILPAVSLPRWQPDAEVVLCPICHTQFSFFVRKHHCRKCGRVVCDACSPHRITIPYQYIVQPPGTPSRNSRGEYSASLIAGEGGYADFSGLGGGERVRLCNPCVPDPNITPPTRAQAQLDPVSAVASGHTRSQSSVNHPPAYNSPLINRLSAYMGAYNQTTDQYARSRTVSMGTHATPTTPGRSQNPPSYTSQQRPGRPGRAPASARPYQIPTDSSPSTVSLSATSVPSSSRSNHPDHRYAHHTHSHTNRALPAVPGQEHQAPAQPRRHQHLIPEEDECPVCHRELPPRTLPDFERHRETHITSCIISHSSGGTPRSGGGVPSPGSGSGPGPSSSTQTIQRRTGMFPYKATEKDCVDSAECTICLEEFEVGVDMARLECLCRFHKRCIDAWFVKNPGRCPVHQHDGFGF